MNLILITAFDIPGWHTYRTSAKLLVSSLLKSYWDGEILIVSNHTRPMFPVGRKGLHEVLVATDFTNREMDRDLCALEALRARMSFDSLIPDFGRYRWVIHFDADCLALRDIGHLLTEEADLFVQPTGKRAHWHPQSLNNPWLTGAEIGTGLFAIRGKLYTKFVEDWKKLQEDPSSLKFPEFEETSHPAPQIFQKLRVRTAFQHLITMTQLKVRPFERGEIMMPFGNDPDFSEFRNAAILDFSGGNGADKQDLSFGLYMMQIYGDENGLFLDLLES